MLHPAQLHGLAEMLLGGLGVVRGGDILERQWATEHFSQCTDDVGEIDELVGGVQLRALDGRSGILASHLGFGDPRRGWDFRSLGRGGVNFEEIIRALNAAGYTGPLSVEWEDNGMEWGFGARDALQYLRRINFAPSDVAFDAAFDKKK